MKILRRITVILFAVVLLMFIGFSIRERLITDRTYPVITLESETFELSISDSETKLLDGVTAYDGKDGDITDKVFVESVSKFISPGTCIITYAVADDDCHTARVTRTLHYSDYTPPEFYMKRSLVYAVDEDIEIRDAIGARDCIDGDISDRITIVATDYVTNTAGVFTVSMQVTNSMGDIIYLDAPVYVENNNKLAPTIALKQNLIYVERGTTPDFEDYIGDVTVNGKKMENYGVLLSTNFDPEKPGTYSVHFYVSSPDGYEGHSILTAIVE